METLLTNPELQITDTVLLRYFQHEDWRYLVRYLNNEKVYENTLLIPYPYTREAAEGWIRENISCSHTSEISQNLAIATAGMLIGGIGYTKNMDPKLSHQAEIGYWLGEPFWNKGVMTTVVNAFSDWIFQNTSFTKLTASIFASNPASGRVLEKCGFIREGYLHRHIKKESHYEDCIIFGKLKA